MSKQMIVGRLVRDVKEVEGSKGKFLSFSVASDSYNKETKAKETVFTDVTLNSYGAGLVPLLVKGKEVVVFGLTGSREHNGKTYPTLMADKLSLGGAVMVTHEVDGKTFAAVVGRLGKDAVEREHEGKTFLSFSVATDVYNKDTKSEETVWLDCTLNHYGKGLVSKLVTGTSLALYGMYVEKADDKATGGVRKVLYVNDLSFFANKKAEAPAESI